LDLKNVLYFRDKHPQQLEINLGKQNQTQEVRCSLCLCLGFFWFFSVPVLLKTVPSLLYPRTEPPFLHIEHTNHVSNKAALTGHDNAQQVATKGGGTRPRAPRAYFCFTHPIRLCPFPHHYARGPSNSI
jgi:hypothetical protein